jgi:hypothetical protein
MKLKFNICTASDCYSFIKCMFGLGETVPDKLIVDTDNDITLDNVLTASDIVKCKSYSKSSNTVRKSSRDLCRLSYLAKTVDLQLKHVGQKR